MSLQNVKRKLAIGLGLVVVLDTAGQLLWKFAVGNLPDWQSPWQAVDTILHQPLFLLVVGVLLLQLFNWLEVLEKSDLSFALPITSLSYVTVAGLSHLWLGEPLGTAKVVGIACVLAGVALIGSGEPQQNPTADMIP